MSSPPLSAGARVGATHRAGPFRIRRIDYPPGLRQSSHHHESFGLTVVLAGRIRETTRSGEETGSPLSVVVKPAGVTHADEIGPGGASTLQVAFDPETAAGLEAAGPLDRWRWLHTGPPVGPLLRLARMLGRRTTAPEDLEETAVEALASVGDDEPPGGDPPAWLARVREALDDELTTGVTVQSLARRAGVHPVSLSRAFRRHYGRTITEYRRRARLRRAAASISSSPSSLSTIAHRVGYSDHPHLCREFRRETGLTPSQFRRIAG